MLEAFQVPNNIKALKCITNFGVILSTSKKFAFINASKADNIYRNKRTIHKHIQSKKDNREW